MNSQIKRDFGWSLEGPEHRSFCPGGAEGHSSPSMWMYSLTQRLSKCQVIGIDEEDLSCRHNASLTHLHLLFPSWWMVGVDRCGECGSENCKLLIMVCLAGDQSPSRSPPSVTSLEQKALLSPGKFQGI